MPCQSARPHLFAEPAMNRLALLPVATLLRLQGLPVAANADELERAEPESVGSSMEQLQRVDEAMGLEIEAGRKAGAALLIARRGKIA